MKNKISKNTKIKVAATTAGVLALIGPKIYAGQHHLYEYYDCIDQANYAYQDCQATAYDNCASSEADCYNTYNTAADQALNDDLDCIQNCNPVAYRKTFLHRALRF